MEATSDPQPVNKRLAQMMIERNRNFFSARNTPALPVQIVLPDNVPVVQGSFVN